MTLTGTGRDLLDDELLADFDARAPAYGRSAPPDPTSGPPACNAAAIGAPTIRQCQRRRRRRW